MGARLGAALSIAAAAFVTSAKLAAGEPDTAGGASSPSHARPFVELMASPGMCAPGSKTACQCPNGSWSQQVCEPTGVRFSACACAAVSVTVPTLPPVPNVDVYVPRPRPRPHRPGKRASGQGLLIGGGVSLLVGTGHLVWGIERLRDTREDPLGIVMIATGGVAMAAGIPLTIVGIVFLATRGRNPSRASPTWTLTPTASGLALSF